MSSDSEGRPKRAYRIRFLPAERTAIVNPADLPYGQQGRAGSILDIALHHGVDIDHACGGSCACSTCHVIIREGLASCGEPSEKEEDHLDAAYGLTPQSRLACQCVPDGSMDLVVEVPGWNRNAVRE